MKIKKFSLVELEWVDAQSELDHMDADRVKSFELVRRKTVGYFILRNKEKVVITFGLIEFRDGNALLDGAFAFPRGCVKKVTCLKEDER